ncbi:MAG: GTP 3',8-cyclase MoaA [Acidobacteriota bacterium]
MALSLRISITDRCNLRCAYCVPPEAVPHLEPKDILRYETMVRVAQIIDRVQPLRKARITGGEPLVRKGVVHLVSMLSAALPRCELCMTTNGALLTQHAKALKKAGLSRMNVSLDSLRPDRFRSLTRGGELQDVLAGIRAALDAGLSPVKINCVLLRGVNEDECEDFVHLAMDEGVTVRFLELMSLGQAAASWQDMYVPAAEVIERLSGRFEMIPMGRDTTADLYRARVDGRSASTGFIRSVSEPFCAGCNRLRLDARGRLSPCLFAEDALDLGAMLRDGADDESLRLAVERLLAGKTPPSRAHSPRLAMSVGG